MDINFFNENGYFILKSILKKDIIDKYNSDFREIFTQQLNILGIKDDLEFLDNFEIMKKLFKLDIDRYLSALTLSSKLFSLYNIISNEDIVNSLKKINFKIPIWQTKPVIHCMANELTIPNGYNGVGVHQDWITLQSSLNTVTIWIPFFNVKKENFPLEIIPKSHLHGLCDGEQKQNYFEIDKEYYNNDDFLPIEVEVGDVVVMSNFTIHRTQTNGNGFRLSASMRYEDASEKTFIERNYPFTEKRVVDRKIISPNFPNREQVIKIYTNL